MVAPYTSGRQVQIPGLHVAPPEEPEPGITAAQIKALMRWFRVLGFLGAGLAAMLVWAMTTGARLWGIPAEQDRQALRITAEAARITALEKEFAGMREQGALYARAQGCMIRQLAVGGSVEGCQQFLPEPPSYYDPSRR